MRFGFSSAALALFTSACIIAPPGWHGPGNDDDTRPVDSGDPGFGSGVVEFAWQVGSGGCIDAGVDTIQATMGATEQVFDCLDGRGRLTVRSGTHDLLLEGIDAKGFARYDGGRRDVEVIDGETVPLGTIRLQARTGDVMVSWRFEDGRLCGPNGVVDVDLAFIQNERIAEQLVTECADGFEQVSGLVAGEYELQALGTDSEGFVQFTALETVVVEQGGASKVELVLTPAD